MEVTTVNNTTIKMRALALPPIDYLDTLPKWISSDKAVIKAICSGMTFIETPDNQKGMAINAILFKIAVSTACQLPTDERHIKALEMEMLKFMSENDAFSKITFEEILTAFRFNAAGRYDEKVTHYNNFFNLDYLGAVLTKWVIYKREIEARAKRELVRKNLFENHLGPELNDDQIIEFSKNEWGRTADFMFVMAKAYSILKDRKEINNDQVNRDRIIEMAHIKATQIYRQLPELNTYDPYSENETAFNIICKKIAVAEYFNGGSF